MNKKDFSKAKIYKIVSEQTEKCYIGSTTKEYLSQRFSWHKSDFKKWKEGKRNDGMTSYQILQFDDSKIVLLEKYPCSDINELHARERYWIENQNCVNKIIPTRTQQEYRNEHKEHIKEYNKIYYEAHQNEILQAKKKRDSKTFECECGSVTKHGDKSKHFKTKKHIAFLEKKKQNQENQNDIKDE